MLDTVVLVKSLNFIAKCVSLLGTVRCKTHSQPSAKLPSAVALPLTVSIPVSASGVDVPVGGVLVPVLVASCTKNEFVASRPDICPSALMCAEPTGSDGTVMGRVKLPLVSAVAVVVAPPNATATLSEAAKFVPIALMFIPGGPL